MGMAENNNLKIELFNAVCAKHYDTVFAYILVSFNNDRDLADDCVQDTMALALQKIDTFLSHPNPGGFLVATARNYVHKHKAAQRKRLLRTASLDEMLDQPSYTEDFDAVFDEPVNIDKLKAQILQLLGDKEFALYELFYEKRMSVAQIAKHMQISEGNVKVRLFRLRLKVKKMVSDILNA